MSARETAIAAARQAREVELAATCKSQWCYLGEQARRKAEFKFAARMAEIDRTHPKESTDV